jgi:iron complex outermembrane receptor protein
VKIRRQKVLITYFLLPLSSLSTASFAQSTPSAASDDAIPVVLTATRLRQPVCDAPASVTVINGETLRRYGIRSIVEAMRFVPGMEVTQADGNQFQVNYHGTNALNPRRMNVMIDNVSMYQTTLAEVRWDTLPVSVDDVDRIEVIRGSGSATYGPNSMMAVVNIITKHPADSPGVFAAVEAGNNHDDRATVRYGGRLASTDFRLTGEHFQNGGFDLSSGTTAQPSFYNNLTTNRLSLAATSTINAQTDLRTDLALWSATRGFSRVEPRETSPAPVDTDAGYLSTTLRHELSAEHEISARAYFSSTSQKQEWRTNYPEAVLVPQLFAMWRANPAYATAILSGKKPSGGTAQDDALAAQAIAAIRALGKNAGAIVDLTANQNYQERRAELEAQDTYEFTPNLRTIVGTGLRYNTGDSDTYFGGKVDNSVEWVFANAEYRFDPRLTLNVGGYGEHSRIAGSNFAPRLALNAKVDANQTLRLVVSQGMRSPDIHEQESNWTYSASNASNPAFEGAKLYQSAISTHHLGDEKMDSYEVGYLGTDPARELSFDVRGFYEHMYHLISERLSIGTFNPTNGGHVNLSGVEMQLTASPTPEWSVFGTYTYLHNDAPAGSTEQSQYARNFGSFGTSYLFAGDWRASIDYTHQSTQVAQTNATGRLGINLIKSIAIGSSHLEVNASVQRLDSRKNVWNRGGTTPVVYEYPSQYLYAVGARISF